MKDLFTKVLLLFAACLFIAGCATERDIIEGPQEGLMTATVTTGELKNPTSVSVAVDGEVVNDGGVLVTSRGFCISTHRFSTIADIVIYQGSGTGKFSYEFTGLSRDSSYFIRAFAINAGGTAYGSERKYIPTFTIGEHFQGGIIFSVDAKADHCLIAAESDLGAAQWGCSGVDLLGATGVILFTGDDNTDYIVSGCTEAGIAARLCADLSLNGYDDWFLPSKAELDTLYKNRDAVGGFSADSYWSSTEIDGNGVYSTDFQTGVTGSADKTSTFRVRAIRQF